MVTIIHSCVTYESSPGTSVVGGNDPLSAANRYIMWFLFVCMNWCLIVLLALLVWVNWIRPTIMSVLASFLSILACFSGGVGDFSRVDCLFCVLC